MQVEASLVEGALHLIDSAVDAFVGFIRDDIHDAEEIFIALPEKILSVFAGAASWSNSARANG